MDFIGVKQIEDVVTVAMPTEHGDFLLSGFKLVGQTEPTLALQYGDIKSAVGVPVRLHSSCVTGDIFSSERCDCGPQLHFAMNHIVSRGAGLVIYLSQEGRGIGLFQKLKAYQLQEIGLDTVEANIALGLPVDCREYSSAIAILQYFAIDSVELMTNNPDKQACLESAGIRVTRRIPVITEPNDNNRRYLATKQEKLGHSLMSV